MEKTKKDLRKFGLVMRVPLALIGGYLWWKGSGAAPYVLGAAAFFLLSALLFPTLLRPIERLWMKVAEVLGFVMTRVILTLAFYLVITPIALVARLFGKDFLHIKKANRRESYWVPVEEDGPGTRPFKPY